MKTKSVMCATFAVCIALSSAVAQANPSTPMAVIDSAASELCGAVNTNPTPDGVIDGINRVSNRGLDELDGALVMITAIHHVCPQYEDLIMDAVNPIAADELCTKPM